MYVAAITYLYTQQVPSRINSNEHPRVACRKLIKACQRREELTKRANFEDRGVNAVLDGYSTSEEIPRIVNYYINKNNLSNLRNGLAFLLSHFCLLRGESARGAEFPDLQTINLEGEGPSQQACPALILVMKNGKTNKNGRLELLQSDPHDPTKQWSYASHYAAMESALKACNMSSTKKTHMARGAGARMCDLGGVEDASIRRLGRWNSDSMNGAYVTGLPREAMRSLAGFGKVKGNFYLPRANLDPCVELQKKVFPLVDEWLDKLDANAIEYNVAARGFLILMKQLRITFLQDSVLIMKDFPAHPVFKHELFSDPLFVTFKSNLEELLLSDSTPQEITLLRAMPALAKELDTRFNAQDASLRLLLQQNQEFQSKLEDISTGRAPVPVRVTVDFSDGNRTVTGVTSNGLASEIQSDSQAGLLSIPPQTTIDTMMFNASDGQQASTSSVPVATSTQGVHRWSEGVHTIHGLWREYTVGLGGGLLIEELNKSRKPWYPKSHKTFHYRRMRIIKAIKNYAEEHSITTDTAVQIAERRRLALQTSLDSIGENISKLYID
ncbi:hypothetical protein G6F49_002912 [Rhizopus delemar]|nr:hypothetical protein G6F49_002912 [Rhizopus delemar]